MSYNEELQTLNEQLRATLETLQAVEANQRTILDSANQSIMLIAPDYSLQLFNRFAAQATFSVFGQTMEIGQSILQYVAPADRQSFLAHFRQAFAGQEVRIEKSIVGVDGSSWWEFFFYPIFLPDGSVRGVTLTASNISARKQTEAQLRETAEYLNYTFEAFGAAEYDNDVRTGEIRPSQRLNALYGYPPEHPLTVAECRSHYHPDDYQSILSIIPEAERSENEQFQREFRIVLPDGTMRWVLSRGRVIFDADGRALRTRGAAIDITERKRAEAALRESEARFRTLTDAVPQVIWANEAGGKAIYFNQRWFLYSGLSLEQSVGPGWQAIVHPEDAPASVERWQEALAMGTVFDTEYRLRRADGAYRWFIGRNVPLRDDDGRIIGWFGSATDVHDRKEAEAALQRSNEELERRVAKRTVALTALNEALQGEVVQRRQVEAQRATLLQRIITTQEDERQRIARELHDSLGQFLSALTLRLAMIQSLDGLPPSVNDELARLQALAGQIDGEIDRLTMELRPPSLDGLGLPDALRGYTLEWSATSGVPVDVVTTGLDDARLPPEVEASAYRIVQEALTNVLKHAQAKTVSVIVERRANTLQVIIEDDGVGFDPDALASQGLGGRQMGLVGINERATLMGGTVSIESAPSAGTTIFVRIPLP